MGRTTWQAIRNRPALNWKAWRRRAIVSPPSVIKRRVVRRNLRGVNLDAAHQAKGEADGRSRRLGRRVYPSSQLRNIRLEGIHCWRPTCPGPDPILYSPCKRWCLAIDLAPKFYPVLSSLQRFFEVLPDFGPAGAGIFRGLVAPLQSAQTRAKRTKAVSPKAISISPGVTSSIAPHSVPVVMSAPALSDVFGRRPSLA